MSARSVLSVLDPDKYDVTQIGITHEGTWITGRQTLDVMSGEAKGEQENVILPGDPSRPGLYRLHKTAHGELFELLNHLDVVFPVLHGTYGEDGTLQGLLEMADIAYVGAGVTGSAVGMDKGVFKDVMRAIGIPVVASIIVLRSEIERNMDDIIQRAEAVSAYPIFTKPANLGSSVGITKCNSRGDLSEGLLEAAAYDRRVLIERGLNAREIEVSVLGNDQPEASVPGEILPSREFYSYESKYIDGTSGLLIPAPIPSEVTEQVQRDAVKAYRAIDCAGMARVDFLLDKDTGNLYLNELNTIPGFTQISMYPKLWQASGIQYTQLVDRLIALAMERKEDRDRTERRFRRAQ